MLLFLDTEEQLDDFLSMVIEERGPSRGWNGTSQVEDAATGRYLGSCCLMVERDSQVQPSLGTGFCVRWGKGYATESSAAMLELGFRRLGFHRVWGKCHTQNAAVGQGHGEAGHDLRGTAARARMAAQHFRSSRIYGMLVGEYPAAAPAAR